ncbi:hypothetical protein [Nocardia sp. NRRL S-836]|uniref:hypothetical protein n=1 Tax=Nocardia sp. NRRL S-836 TaxID=1519492 RepID=UPI000B0BCBD5|nr:hypothetical protein [Nocardia sp. NRRL S-836]
MQASTLCDAVPRLIERDLITHRCDEIGTASLTCTVGAAIGLLLNDAGQESTSSVKR